MISNVSIGTPFFFDFRLVSTCNPLAVFSARQVVELDEERDAVLRRLRLDPVAQEERLQVHVRVRAHALALRRHGELDHVRRSARARVAELRHRAHELAQLQRRADLRAELHRRGKRSAVAKPRARREAARERRSALLLLARGPRAPAARLGAPAAPRSRWLAASRWRCRQRNLLTAAGYSAATAASRRARVAGRVPSRWRRLGVERAAPSSSSSARS